MPQANIIPRVQAAFIFKFPTQIKVCNIITETTIRHAVIHRKSLRWNDKTTKIQINSHFIIYKRLTVLYANKKIKASEICSIRDQKRMSYHISKRIFRKIDVPLCLNCFRIKHFNCYNIAISFDTSDPWLNEFVSVASTVG